MKHTNNKDDLIILYKDNVKIYLGPDSYEIIRNSKNYKLIHEKNKSLYYFTTYIKKYNGIDMYNIDVKTEFIRSLGRDCYVLRKNNKEFMYNAEASCFIGRPHYQIFPCITENNNLIIANRDCVTDNDKKYIITSYCDYNGNEIDNQFDKAKIIDINNEINNYFVK